MYQTMIVETKAFIEYLEEFPSKDRTLVHASAKFWWTTTPDKASDGNGSRGPHIAEGLTKILSCFLVVERRGYFGPRGQAPREDGLQRLVMKKKKDAASKNTTKASKLGSTSTELISNAVLLQYEKWFDFDPHMEDCTKKWRVILGGKDQRASKCGKRRRRVLGSMVLANQTKRPP
jgi:hypothetical protein